MGYTIIGYRWLILLCNVSVSTLFMIVYFHLLNQVKYSAFLLSRAMKNTQWKRKREREILFNDALNTFYLRLYGVRHMVKDHSDSEKGNPLPPHLLLINSKGSFICTIPQTG